MAPKHHPTPLSGGDRKALNKELSKARAMTNILATQSAEMRAKGEAMLQTGRQIAVRKLERAHVEQRRADRSVAYDRPGDQRRLCLAGDPLRAMQVAERRRPCGDEASADHVRARSRQPPALPEMRQGGPTPLRDLAPAWLVAAPPPSGGLGCDRSRNHRP